MFKAETFFMYLYNITSVIYFSRESASDLLFDFHCFCFVSSVPKKKERKTNVNVLLYFRLRISQ